MRDPLPWDHPDADPLAAIQDAMERARNQPYRIEPVYYYPSEEPLVRRYVGPDVRAAADIAAGLLVQYVAGEQGWVKPVMTFDIDGEAS